jgi:MFS family permease
MDHKAKLWTPSFLILWQSQLVSIIGDAVYAIALGFWVLAETGSTALMGTLMAVSTLPGILVSPFAGVLIDRTNKKALMIAMEAIRGACIILLAVLAYMDLAQIWMVIAAGILLSTCGAVFHPGIMSSVPDIVPKSKITNANSAFSIVMTAGNLIGNAAGGFLYQALGAPLLFLINGLSFLFSGASLPFVKIPNVHRPETPQFFKDMADGFRYMWRQTGLRLILIVAALSNFFSYIAITLFVPFCQYTPGFGSGVYGILMASFMGGAFIGFAALSIINIKSKDKMKLFVLSSICENILIIVALNQPNIPAMSVLLVLAGITNAVVNVFLISTVQASTPTELRGKVMSFMTVTTQGLTPFAMALGGVLGSVLPVRLVITASFAIGFLTFIPSYFSKSFKEFITADTAAVPDATPELE